MNGRRTWHWGIDETGWTASIEGGILVLFTIEDASPNQMMDIKAELMTPAS